MGRRNEERKGAGKGAKSPIFKEKWKIAGARSVLDERLAEDAGDFGEIGGKHA